MRISGTAVQKIWEDPEPELSKLTPPTIAGFHHTKLLERRAPRIGGPELNDYNFKKNSKQFWIYQSELQSLIIVRILEFSFFLFALFDKCDGPQNAKATPRRALKRMD